MGGAYTWWFDTSELELYRLGKRLMFSVFYYFAFTFLKGCLENKDS